MDIRLMFFFSFWIVFQAKYMKGFCQWKVSFSCTRCSIGFQSVHSLFQSNQFISVLVFYSLSWLKSNAKTFIHLLLWTKVESWKLTSLVATSQNCTDYTADPRHSNMLFHEIQYIMNQPWIPYFPCAENFKTKHFLLVFCLNTTGQEWSSYWFFVHPNLIIM